jgi:hypothetical protein
VEPSRLDFGRIEFEAESCKLKANSLSLQSQSARLREAQPRME